MKEIRRFFNRLSVKMIGSIAILVILLTIIVGFFSYQVFTRTMLMNTAASLRQVTDMALVDALRWSPEEYLSIGEERMMELYEDNYERLRSDESEMTVEISRAYNDTASRLAYLCELQDVEAIGIMVPDKEKDYSECTMILLAQNQAQNELADAEETEEPASAEQNEEELSLDPDSGFLSEDEENLPEDAEEEADYRSSYRLGERIPVANEDARQAIKNIWERKSFSGTTFDLDYDEQGSVEPRVSVFRVLDMGQEYPAGIVVAVRSVRSMVEAWNRFVVGISLIAGGMILIGVLLVGLYLRTRVVKPVDRIVNETYRFAKKNEKANRDLVSDVGSITEMRVLAESIDKMEDDTLKKMDEIARMSRESEKVETELSMAAKLQLSVLPKGEELSGRKDFTIAARMNPAREVGGDFYDFFLMDDNHLAILIADVSDKGISAAFFMSASKTLIKARAGVGGSAAEIINYAENELSKENEAGMFVTAWLGIIDLATGEVNACNAGHNYPVIMKKDSEECYQIVKTPHGPPLCFLPGVEHVEYSFSLQPGDRIFLYTDGVTEAVNSEGERFGNDRLVRALNDDYTIGDESLILRVKAAVDLFAGTEPQFDDITMVSFTYVGTHHPDSYAFQTS